MTKDLLVVRIDCGGGNDLERSKIIDPDSSSINASNSNGIFSFAETGILQ